MRPSLPTRPFIEFEKDEIERSIPERFERQVAKYPHRLAVKTKDHALTYDALNRAANRLARAILEKRGEGEEPVLLLLDNGAPMIAAMIGALKAAKIYVPLDPSFPILRHREILEDTAAGLIVTDSQNFSVAEKLAAGKLELVNIDELDSDLGTENLNLPLRPDDAARIIYTSGSTGEPKGVVLNHRRILHEVMSTTNGCRIRAGDRVCLLTSPGTGQGMVTSYAALLNGATLCPFDIRLEGLPRLAAWLNTEEITVYTSVPAVFRSFTRALAEGQEFLHLRVIKLGADQVRTSDVELYKQHFPESRLKIFLACTEAGNLCQYSIDQETEIGTGIVPVGYAVDGMEILLLDEAGKEVGFNQVGEIVVRSRYLSLGYWRRADLTEAKFLPDPEGGDKRLYLTGDLGRMRPDGCLEYLGRKDFQVKISGHRIEAGEIEAALLALDTIKDAVVVAQGDSADEKRLVAYIVPVEKPPPTVSTLRRALAEKLPDYMIPSAFVIMESLPVSAIGKVDLQALPAAGNARPEQEPPFVAPLTSIEAALAKIWAETLGKKRVGIHDNFFDLGGHSLSATQILSRMRDLLDVEMPLDVLFEKPTIAELAEYLDRLQPGIGSL
jgi:amino acid adenylation domain-containing protein